ncbi:hypothetical protein C5167_011601 [Papaver somniferum]|uniref:Homologous recombination OB-fold protein OB-fold domain-containing protein n=1 Tax=Papaver somniferum TaxID=3469 RepID=A0A4Y7K4S5_PAPSO|nr:hypothetical protein C5167_011601 [Papaver somniferum]
MAGEDPWEGFDEDELAAVLDSYSDATQQSSMDYSTNTPVVPNISNPYDNRNKSVVVDLTPCPIVKHSERLIHNSRGACSSRKIIPGPARELQKLQEHRHRRIVTGEADVSTQVLQRLVRDEIEGVNDHHFQTKPWFFAQQYFSEGRTALGSIKPINQRIERLVVLVEEQRKNLDDYSLKVKDPSGKMGANVYRKVVEHPDYGKHIRVGAVLVLKKVVIFSPTNKNHWINITVPNIEEVIPSESTVGEMRRRQV